mmetsp:Transcript_100888/g.289602  ORF Transcript_100888/g.289602 Transcript_100888/m.289602 type:complete len:274 (+) Transcript_100888:198-1019(+)
MPGVGVPLHGTQKLGAGNQYSLRIVSTEGSWKCRDCGCDQFGDVSETELCMVCDAQVKIIAAEETDAAKAKAASDRSILGIDFHGEPEEKEAEVVVKKPKEMTPAQLAKMSRQARHEHGSGGSHMAMGPEHGTGTERKRMPLPVYTKSKKPLKPTVKDGMCEVVFAEKVMGISVDDREWAEGTKIVVTALQQNGVLAGAKESWAVEAVNGVSLEELGLATHSELQAYIASIPVRPLTLTLKAPPRGPTEHELEEMREAEEAKRAAEAEAKVSG